MKLKHIFEFIAVCILFTGALPTEGRSLWFRVLQTCENGSLDWSQIPASGTSTKGLKAPAVLLEVIPAGPVAHQH